MIIVCVNCSKKFNVNSELIPEYGRQVKCSSCDHIWHFRKENSFEKLTNISNKVNEQDPLLKEITFEEDDPISIQKTTKLPADPSHEKSNNTTINTNQSNKKINNFFSYLIVFIISFVLLIILIDTLKSPLINIFPGIEIMLFNLFETLKDIKSFIIDLT